MTSAKTENNGSSTFLWRIENFSHWDDKCDGEKITSPQFCSHLLECPGCLHVFPKGKDERDQHLRVQFQHTGPIKHVIVDLSFELSFLDGNGLALTTGVIRNKVKTHTPLDFPDCPTQEEVFQCKRSSFLPHDTLTVRFRLFRSGSSDPSLYRYYSVRSRIDVKETSILLRRGFLRTLELDKEKEFFLILKPQSFVNSMKCTYSLTGSSLSNAVVNFQIRRMCNDEPLLITCKLSLLNTEGKTIKYIEYRHKFNQSDGPQNWDIPHILSMQELMENCEIDSIYTKIIVRMNDISEIVSELWGCPGVEYDFPIDDVAATSEACTQPDISQQRSNSLTTLGEDLLFIYKDQTLYDFELRSDDVSFPVHKNVLSARSPVFRAMFCGDMQEVKSTSVDIPDVDAHTLNCMLTFLYAGTVDDLQWEGAAKLYYAADKYQVLSLKHECLSLLQSSISVSNVCDILVIADRHQDSQLISFAHDFILNHFDEVLLSEEWDKFLDSDSHFAGKTMKQIYKQKLQLGS